jgi:hypothetical protein
MIGWVCRLKLLLVFSSAVILGSESFGTHDHILLSQIRDSPILEGQVPVFISPRSRWPSYTHGHWFLCSSPPTTRRAGVEVFEPASDFSWRGPTETTVSIVIPTIPLFLLILCRGNVFTESMPSNERLFWFLYSGIQASCHNMHFFLPVTGLHVWPIVFFDFTTVTVPG